jgi:2-polyprenyl-3-methyl-5-hydroxy-6-metoxy-1,4-benzoquinol methylase
MNTDLANLHKKPEGYYEGNRTDMLKYLPPGIRRSLDFGCGFGRFSHLVKTTFGAETWGVEIDPTAAREAAQRLDTVIQADALASVGQIPDHHFDCVILFDILEHLADPYSLLLTIKPKLTGTGVVVASIPNIRFYRTFWKYVVHGDWEYQDEGILDKTHLRFFTRKSIISTFERLGYRILTLEGMHPTTSRTYRWLNAILLNALADVRYKHFAVVAVPREPAEARAPSDRDHPPH